MPLPEGTRYRMKKGSKIRLAFAKGSSRVIEAKNMMTGAMHGPKEMMKDKKHSKMKKAMMGHR